MGVWLKDRTESIIWNRYKCGEGKREQKLTGMMGSSCWSLLISCVFLLTGNSRTRLLLLGGAVFKGCSVFGTLYVKFIDFQQDLDYAWVNHKRKRKQHASFVKLMFLNSFAFPSGCVLLPQCLCACVSWTVVRVTADLRTNLSSLCLTESPTDQRLTSATQPSPTSPSPSMLF